MNLQSTTPDRRYVGFSLFAPTSMNYGVRGVIAVLLATSIGGLAWTVPASAAPQAAAQFVSISGTVSKVDAAANSITVKTDKGEDSVVKFDDRTTFMRMPPGETDTKKATPIQKTDVTTGDRVLARVRSAEGSAAVPATRVFIMSKADLAKRDEKVQEDWATRSLTGIVQTVDSAAKQAVIKVRGKDVAVDLAGKVTYRRYNPESTKATDMRPSSMAEILPGDQLRVLGERNEDQTKVTAESVVTGAFRTVGMVVKSVDPAAGTITGIDAATKKPIVVKVTDDSSVRKFDPMVAMGLARQLNPNAAQGGGRPGMRPGGGAGGPGGGAGGPGGANPGGGSMAGGPPSGGPPGGGAANGGTPTGSGGPGGAGARAGMGQGGPGGMGAGGMGAGGMGAGGMGPGGPGGMRGGGRMDIGKVIENQPKIQLADLKPNDQLIVYGLVSADLAKLSALNVIAGAEPILTAAPKGGVDPLGGSWNFGDAGGGGGGGPQ